MDQTIERLERYKHPKQRVLKKYHGKRPNQKKISILNEFEIYVILFIVGVITTIATMNLYRNAPYVLHQNHLMQENNAIMHSNKKVAPPQKIVRQLPIIYA